MITHNADGTYTVAGILTVLSMDAALALLDDGSTYMHSMTAGAAVDDRHVVQRVDGTLVRRLDGVPLIFQTQHGARQYVAMNGGAAIPLRPAILGAAA